MSKIFVHATKNSGENLLDVKIDGWEVQPNTVSIHTIQTNALFQANKERLKFNVGGNYSLASIADFLVTTFGYTAKVCIGTADAVDLSTFSLPAAMNVYGNNTLIADGDATPSTGDHTDFGSVSAASGDITRVFTITNTGEGTLNLTGSPIVAVSGTNAADFTVIQPQGVLPPGGAVTFSVVFNPSAAGSRTAALSIANSGPAGKNPYNFSISGTGL